MFLYNEYHVSVQISELLLTFLIKFIDFAPFFHPTLASFLKQMLFQMHLLLLRLRRKSS